MEDSKYKLARELSTTNIDWCAQRLLGAQIIRQTAGGKLLRAMIVETESYDQTDPASHSYVRTNRSSVMYGQAGTAYVYLIYGVYYCLNVVCGPQDFGAGVLIRAAEPISGITASNHVLSGPGKLCRELAINKSFNRHDLANPPLQVLLQTKLDNKFVVSAPRIGLSTSLHARKRFYIKGNAYISHK